MPPLNNRQIVSESQIHQDLQLSPDGRRLLTGLQTDASAGELSATSYLFDIQGAEPVPLGSMTVTVPRVAGPTRAYPRTRLSDSGNHVAMGWFRHHYSTSQLEQLLHVQVFAVPEPEPAMESAEKADPAL